MVKTSPSKARAADWIPGKGAKIPDTSQPKHQNIRNSGSNISTNSTKAIVSDPKERGKSQELFQRNSQ